jgi:hypothetical protein
MIMGASTRLNGKPICVWPTVHPSVNPPAAESSATRIRMATNINGLPKLTPTFVPITSHAATTLCDRANWTTTPHSRPA